MVVKLHPRQCCTVLSITTSERKRKNLDTLGGSLLEPRILLSYGLHFALLWFLLDFSSCWKCSSICGLVVGILFLGHSSSSSPIIGCNNSYSIAGYSSSCSIAVATAARLTIGGWTHDSHFRQLLLLLLLLLFLLRLLLFLLLLLLLLLEFPSCYCHYCCSRSWRPLHFPLFFFFFFYIHRKSSLDPPPLPPLLLLQQQSADSSLRS